MNDLLIRRLERYFANPSDPRAMLAVGTTSLACLNVRRAMGMLGLVSRASDSELFDAALETAVREFQRKYAHKVSDGVVGPGTRRLLVTTLLEDSGPGIFNHFSKTEPPVVFISYAWKDQGKVDKVDQWLRDRGVSVVRDQTDFVAGDAISESIRLAIASSDKVLAMYSANSAGREWPSFERFIASELEEQLHETLLVYVCLDDTPPPESVAGRLRVDARSEPLKRVGERLLQAVHGGKLPVPRYEYDEDKPL